MTIIKKRVVKYGSSGHVVMPKLSVGRDAVIIYDDDFKYVTELIRNAYLMSKFGDHQINEVEKDLKDLKKSVESRMAFVERSLALIFDKIGMGTRNSGSTLGSEPCSSGESEASSSTTDEQNHQTVQSE